MDRIALSLITNGVRYGYRGLGLRAAYRGIRMWHWLDRDVHDPAGAGARNVVRGTRDRLRREWGGRWMGALGALPPVPPLPYNLNEWHPHNPRGTWDLLKAKSPAELNAYNAYAVREVIYKPASRLIQNIIQDGQNPALHRDRPALYRGLTSDDPDKVSETVKSIISLFTNNWHRAEQMKWFLDKENQLLASAKQEEKVKIMKYYLQGYFQELHNLNDLLKKFMEKILALIGNMAS